MAYYVGIDGGGTKTRAVLADETTVLAKSMTGGSNMVRLGEAQTREAVHAAVRQICASAKISPSQIRAICIGAAGAARSEISAKLRSILSELIPDPALVEIEITSDTEIALEAAFGAGPGVVAISGTGSIVYGRDAAGHSARAGGWGFALSDEGSGHWIGRRAVSAVLSAQDAQRDTSLTAMVLDVWKLTSIEELVQNANSTPSPDFPRLFPVVLRAANEADPVALDLLTEAGTHLAELAAMVIRRLAPSAPKSLPVAMTGSVFRQSAIVRKVFYNQLTASFPGIAVHEEFVDPVLGALARARTARRTKTRQISPE
jgi:glucosamine kinase